MSERFLNMNVKWLKSTAPSLLLSASLILPTSALAQRRVISNAQYLSTPKVRIFSSVQKQAPKKKSKIHNNVIHPKTFKQPKVVQKIQGFAESLLTGRFASWGIHPQYTKRSGINLGQAWKKFQEKKEITVAVIDTGIDYFHPFLKENIKSLTGASSRSNFGMDFSYKRKVTKTPFDAHGHGTHVTGIIKSVFPNVKVLPLKYFNPQASGQDNLNSTIQALKYAVDSNVDIINYSGGGPEPAIEELRILKIAEKKGILVVAASGNERSNIDDKKNAYYPASYGLSNIITVTAHDQNMNPLKSSNWGAKTVDVSAPGYKILSSVPTTRGSSAYMTGTSQATAFVTGAAALLKSQYPNLKPNQIKSLIINSAKKETTLYGKCNSSGRLDVAKAFSLIDASKKQFSSKREVANKR